MKFNVLVLTSLVALTAAQSGSTTTNSAPTTTVSLSPEQSCAKNCADTDLCCIAGCFKVPCPNGSQANDTNNCVAACPQGTGTPADNQRYISCQNSCFSNHFFPLTATGGSGASQTSASNSDATTTGKDSSSTGSSGSGTQSSNSKSSGTSSGSASSSTNAAPATQLKLGASAVGIAGLALGLWAL